MKDKPIPYAKDKDMNYENFIATCPHCGFQNIFNRVSDLETVEPIGFKQVICLNSSCKKQFNINGDLVSENYVYLIMDCYDLLKNKRYMYCILNLCQACEMFFVRAIEIKLIYQPFKDKVLPDDCDQLNDLCKKLHTKIKDYTFENLKRIFFDLYFGFSDFYVDEFKLPLTIEKLCTVINENYTITLNAPNNTLGRLNELLMNPNFYDILKAKKPNMSISNKITALVDKTKDYRNRSFSDLNYDEKSNIKRLNRLLLEETYPQETPKSLYLNNKVFQSVESIEDYINTIDCRKNKIPQDAEIDLYPNINARELFRKLKLTKINELRNHVVHKYGYRPDKLLVERNLENIREVIFGLVGMFQIKHILSYLN